MKHTGKFFNSVFYQFGEIYFVEYVVGKAKMFFRLVYSVCKVEVVRGTVNIQYFYRQ